MNGISLVLTGIGLSMDAFAAAVCQGLAMPRFHWRWAGILALYFGGFQALMPLLGWALGGTFAGEIQYVDHWIAFVLLTLIGGNMFREALEDAPPPTPEIWDGRVHHGQFLLLAVATSIDALAAGVTFAFLQVAILPAVAVIGTITFCLTLLGVRAGCTYGRRYERRAQLTGGGILILLGVHILLEHLLG